jgi:hypothetical protein
VEAGVCTSYFQVHFNVYINFRAINSIRACWRLVVLLPCSAQRATTSDSRLFV